MCRQKNIKVNVFFVNLFRRNMKEKNRQMRKTTCVP